MKYDLGFDQQGPSIIDDETREPIPHSVVIKESAVLREALRESNDVFADMVKVLLTINAPKHAVLCINQYQENEKRIGGE